MFEILSEEFCQRLSQSAAAIIGHHVLVTDEHGVVLGSFDPSRVGSLHEASLDVIRTGRQIYHSTGEADQLNGTKPGTTIPLFIGNRVVGTIGITGAPEEISKYAMLIQQMAQTFLDFQERQRSSQYSDYEKLTLLHAITGEISEDEADSVYNSAYKLGYDLNLPRVVLRVEMEPLNGQEQTGESPLSRKIIDYMSKELFVHPQDFLCIQNSSEVVAMPLYFEASGGMDVLRPKVQEILDAFGGECRTLRLGVGAPKDGALGLHASYEDASLALRVLNVRNLRHGYLTACDIFLEKLALDLDETVCGHVSSTLLRHIEESEEGERLLHLIYHWCQSHFNFSKTADALHIHKSTLVYRFRRAEELYGLDLHDFDKTMALYLVYLRRLMKQKG